MPNSLLYYREKSQSLSYINVYCQEMEILTLTQRHLCITSDVIAMGLNTQESEAV